MFGNTYEANVFYRGKVNFIYDRDSQETFIEETAT